MDSQVKQAKRAVAVRLRPPEHWQAPTTGIYVIRCTEGRLLIVGKEGVREIGADQIAVCGGASLVKNTTPSHASFTFAHIRSDSEILCTPFAIDLPSAIEASRIVAKPVPLVALDKLEVAACFGEFNRAEWEEFDSWSNHGAYHALSVRHADEPLVDDSQVFDAVVIGAGPTGVSAASHIKERGLNVIVFGEPASFWKQHILPLPLRSKANGTDLSSTKTGTGFLDFAVPKGFDPGRKIDFGWFLAYFHNFLEKAGITPISARVVSLRHHDNEWNITARSADGVFRQVRARNVVVAIGLHGMERIPPVFAKLPEGFVFHSSQVTSYKGMNATTVAVIGSGQSAIEAALEAESAGANVILVVRGRQTKFRSLHSPGNWLYKKLFSYAPTYTPFLPIPIRDRVLRYLLKGTAEPELEKKLEESKVVVVNGAMVENATILEQTNVKITLSTGQTIVVHRVILGTGYQFDARKISFLGSISRKDMNIDQSGFPILNEYCESTAKGLYFAGFSTVGCIGPKAQFVAGTAIVSNKIANGVDKSVRSRC